MIQWIFKHLVFFICLSAPLGLTAGEFRVHGRAEGQIGEKVRIIVPADPFSGKEITLASAITDSMGGFTLQAEVKITQFGWISLGFGRSEIYLSPGLDLEINLLMPETANAGRNPYLEPPLLSLELIREQPKTLNHDISLFNAAFDEFLMTCGPGLKNRRNKTLADSLDRLIREIPIDTSQAYLRSYIFYKMADIHVFLREMRYPAAFKKYLESQVPDFANIAYADFFHNFFTDYLLARSTVKFQDDLDYCINKTVDLRGLLDSLGKDSLLRNERIRELVLLQQLPGLFGNKNYSRTNLLAVMTMLSRSTKFSENRQISDNLHQMLVRFDALSPLPPFLFRSLSGSDITNQSLKEGTSCLIFFRNNCDLCDAEHDLIPALQKKYGEKLRFLSICCDPGGFGLTTYLRDHPAYKWEFADFNLDYDFLEAMDIRSFPLFLILGEGGKILKYPAPKPSERLELALDRLTAEH